MVTGSGRMPDPARRNPPRGPANPEALTPVAGAQPYDPNGRGSRGVDAANTSWRGTDGGTVSAAPQGRGTSSTHNYSKKPGRTGPISKGDQRCH